VGTSNMGFKSAIWLFLHVLLNFSRLEGEERIFIIRSLSYII